MSHKERQTVVLLIDDQPIISESIKMMLEGEENIVFHYCQDPREALLTAHNVAPTVILQDLIMPDIDGLVLVKYFKTNQELQNIPLIVLSSKEDPLVKAKAFECGANDYLVKLPDKIELRARLRYHSKSYIRLLERNEAYASLAESQRVLQSELAEAAVYVKSLLPKPLQGEITTAWIFIPSEALGGDSFGYHWLDENNLSIYLIDVCGHGVGAALLSVILLNVLRQQTLSNCNFYDPTSVLKALNDSFPMEEHNQMFFTAWYGVYNKEKKELTYASGGHPPAVLIRGKPPIVQELGTNGMIVGGFPGTQYTSATVKIEKSDVFYLFSDGAFEVHNRAEEMLGYNSLLNILKNSDDIQEIVASIKNYRGNRLLEDDFSLLQIVF